jgi:hypothetical protein
MNTEGFVTQGQPNPDLELFVGATQFRDVAALATLASAGAGLLTLNLAAGQAGTFFANISAFLRRTGILATPSIAQSQFGTGASLPGPTAVANTSGPLATGSRPPVPSAQLPTLAGPVTGASKKGIQVNSMDVIYQVTTADLTVLTLGLTKTLFVDNVAPSVVNILALGANGLVKTQRANPYRANVAIAVPAMTVDSGAEIILNVNMTTPGGGTAKFYGVNLKCSYNFN